MPNNKHPFDCQRCDAFPQRDFKISPITKGWLKIYPAERLIHVHFGRATVNEAESGSEAEWVLEIVVHQWYTEHPNTKFFIAADFLREDDGEFPYERSKEAYQKILQHPQTGLVVCYRTTPGIRMFITVLVQIARTLRKLKIVKTEADMEKLYAQWLPQGNTSVK